MYDAGLSSFSHKQETSATSIKYSSSLWRSTGNKEIRMSERIARIPRTNSLGIARDCRVHRAQRHGASSFSSEHRIPFLGFIVLIQLIFPVSASPTFNYCLLPAVLLPLLVNIRLSQSEAEVPMGLATPYPPRPESVTAQAAAGPPRAQGRLM